MGNEDSVLETGVDFVNGPLEERRQRNHLVRNAGETLNMRRDRTAGVHQRVKRFTNRSLIDVHDGNLGHPVA